MKQYVAKKNPAIQIILLVASTLKMICNYSSLDLEKLIQIIAI